MPKKDETTSKSKPAVTKPTKKYSVTDDVLVEDTAPPETLVERATKEITQTSIGSFEALLTCTSHSPRKQDHATCSWPKHCDARFSIRTEWWPHNHREDWVVYGQNRRRLRISLCNKRES